MSSAGLVTARTIPFATPADDHLISPVGEPSNYQRSDAGNAELIAAMYADLARFDHAQQGWFIWRGHHWTRDRDGAIRRMAKDAIRDRLVAAAHIERDDDRKLEIRWAMQSESRRGLDAMIALAQSERPLAVSGDEWDRHPMLLGVNGGTVDLQTGYLRPGRASDGITRAMPVTFDAMATCPRWEQFVREIFASNPELADYMARVIGYTLTGLTDEQILWVLFGGGSNGKSTFVETLMKAIFGPELAWAMPFPASDWSDSMGEYQKAALAGRRFVASSEVTRRGRLNEELIKSLTGGDAVNARHPYGRPFQFTPCAKFFIRVNEKPQIRDESHGMWRRIKLIPFLETFPVNTALADALTAEGPGILQWAIRGCLDWQRAGLREPAIVQAATAEYRAESDPLTEFFAECCVILDGISVRAGELYGRYLRWAGDHTKPEDRLSQTAFGKRIKAKFSSREDRHTTYLGIGLRES